MSTAICWFKNDLRLDDNPALLAASHAERLLCVYCIDARHDAASVFGPARMGAHRKAFLRQSLVDLRQRIEALGSQLLVLAGEAEDVLSRLVSETGAEAVHTTAEFAPEECTTVQRVAQAVGRDRLHLYESGGLYTRDALPFALDDLPRVFTVFRQQVEAQSTIPAPQTAPTRLPTAPPTNAIDALPDRGRWPDTPSPFHGGESAALARLQDYIWQTQAIVHYKETRNQLIGDDFSTHLSPWLALGCLSPRRIADEVARFEAEVTANQSTYWVLFELQWREFFRWVASYHGSRLFWRSGLLGRKDRPRAQNAERIAAWQSGRTGMPFIDANMRELAHTGYMSNRGRQNVASFLARDLGQDWRVGAAWFESQLVDYDVASNWGNWANVAGVGTDKRDRGFNVLAQAQRYDGEADYISHWLPELAEYPQDERHTPFWQHAPTAGTPYPALIIAPPDSWNAT